MAMGQNRLIVSKDSKISLRLIKEIVELSAQLSISPTCFVQHFSLINSLRKGQ